MSINEIDKSPLLNYQDRSANELHNNNGGFLYGPMGSGKTRTILTALWRLVEDYGWRHFITPTLVVCRKSSLQTWQDQSKQWFGMESTIIRGSAMGRKVLWNQAHNRSGDNQNYRRLYICTYGTLKQDMKDIQSKRASEQSKTPVPLYWTMVIADEAHSFRNKDTDTFKKMQKLQHRFFIPTTGTAIRRGPQEIWTILNLLDPKRFGSYWGFVNKYCHVFDGEYGKEIIGAKDPEKLKQLLKPFVVRITEEEAAKELPEKQRVVVPLVMSPKVRKMYDSIDIDKELRLSNEGILVAPNEMTSILRLRQLMTTPRLIDPQAEIGAPMEAVAERLEEDPHAFIITSFAKAFPIFTEYLTKKGHEHIYQLRGGASPEEVRGIIRDFEQSKGILMCTVEFAQSYSLNTCKTGFVVGPGWNPDDLEQAEDRLRRVSSLHKHFTIYYMLHRGTKDDLVVDMLNQKQHAINQFDEAVKPDETH